MRHQRQLTKVKVTCNFEGALVRLDGRTLFTGPGVWEGQIRAGPHTLTSSKEGMLPDERSVVLPGGDAQTFAMRVYRAEEMTEYRRAFSPALPIATLVGGLAAVGAGVALHLSAKGGFEQYDQGITGCATAAQSTGCVPTPDLVTQRTSAAGMQTGAIALYSVGGAAIVASAILFYVGRPIAYRKSVNVEAPPATITLIPLITPTAAGAMAHIEF